jgi:hypothetical protein
LPEDAAKREANHARKKKAVGTEREKANPECLPSGGERAGGRINPPNLNPQKWRKRMGK